MFIYECFGDIQFMNEFCHINISIARHANLSSLNNAWTRLPAQQEVITGIMKQNECMKAPESLETADNTEQSARGESSELSINPVDTDSDSVSNPQAGFSLSTNPPGFEDQACSLAVVSTPDSAAVLVRGSQLMEKHTAHIMYYPQIASRDLDDTYPGILGAKVI